MRKRTRLNLLIILAFLIFGGFTSAKAQQDKASDETASEAEEINQPGLVVIDGKHVLTVYDSMMSLSPEQRAERITDRIVQTAEDNSFSPTDVRLLPRAGWTEILIGDEAIMAVTEADARVAGQPRDKLAADDAANISRAIYDYRHERSWRIILKGILYTILVTLVLIPEVWLIRRVRFALRDRINAALLTLKSLPSKTHWQISLTYLLPITLAVGAVFRWLLILASLEIYFTLTLGFFSSTRHISLTVTKWVLGQLDSLGQAVLSYLPNLMVISVIVLITYYLARIVHLIFSQIANGELKFSGFYPDWALPTEKLVRMLIVILALVVCFPYLPGAKSPAFQGVSIFLGVLLSFGSSSAVANAIAGVILTYMRSFLLGDWVEISGTTGEVIEKNLLVTRLLTPKSEVVTIPNATVMSGSVRNFSAEAKKSGVIFHITATIGYDAPWRTVHQLLTSAAAATANVLKEPAPFVLQSALNDFYVSYELNAYTANPREMLNIYSDLHKNIQDQFNEAGVEICSPHFSALRDGNVIAIPDEYIKPDYRQGAFRVVNSSAENSAPLDARDSAAQG